MKIIVRIKGSPSSGNYGHAGIPGHQGGSAPGGSPLDTEVPEGYAQSMQMYSEKLVDAWESTRPRNYGENSVIEAAYYYGFRIGNEYGKDLEVQEAQYQMLRYIENASDLETAFAILGESSRWISSPANAHGDWNAATELGGNGNARTDGSGGIPKSIPQEKLTAAYTARKRYIEAYFRKKYGDEIEVFRGLKGEQQKIVDSTNSGDRLSLPIRELSSFTPIWPLARTFGSVVKFRIKAEDVWALPSELGVKPVQKFGSDVGEVIGFFRTPVIEVISANVMENETW